MNSASRVLDLRKINAMEGVGHPVIFQERYNSSESVLKKETPVDAK
jgi:hypothetical protein